MSDDLDRLLRTASVGDEESLDALARALKRRGYPRKRPELGRNAANDFLLTMDVVRLNPRWTRSVQLVEGGPPVLGEIRRVVEVTYNDGSKEEISPEEWRRRLQEAPSPPPPGLRLGWVD